MLEMRSYLPLASISLMGSLMGVLSFGCATTAQSAGGQERVVVAVDAQTRTSSDVVEVTEIVPPVAPVEVGPARRRLSQTVTLGQGTSEPVYTPAPPGGQGQGQGQGNSQNVTVNNHVTVVQPAPVYYGGYGGYGSFGRSGAGAPAGREGFGHGTSANGGAWAPSGWEGAGRTAAPGRTPGVGGNFSPAPSFGPRSMK